MSVFPLSPGDGIVSNIPVREVRGRECPLYDEVISVHFDAFNVSFLVEKVFTFDDAHDATKQALAFSQDV